MEELATITTGDGQSICWHGLMSLKLQQKTSYVEVEWEAEEVVIGTGVVANVKIYVPRQCS